MSATQTGAEQRIVESDETIAAMLEAASIPTLMMSIVHLTGRTDILRGAIRPKTPLMGEVQGYLDESEKAAVRALALEALKAYRDNGCVLPPPPDAAWGTNAGCPGSSPARRWPTSRCSPDRRCARLRRPAPRVSRRCRPRP